MQQVLFRKLKYLLVLAFIFAAFAGAGAQSLTVKGKVTDEHGGGLPGVTVLVKGTSNGTSTDAEGSYSLPIGSGNATLVITFIGYNTQEIAINHRSTVHVSLKPDAKTPEEVVVIGYGTAERKDLTGAVTSLAAQDYRNRKDRALNLSTAINWSVLKRLTFHSVGWRISEEPFLKTLPAINDLKLRLSYGEAGNNRIDNGLWRRTFIPSSDRGYGMGDVNNGYYRAGSNLLVNPALKWETTITRNLGLDYGLLNNRISGTVDLCHNTTKDLLVKSTLSFSAAQAWM